jgi:hypothetical protein
MNSIKNPAPEININDGIINFSGSVKSKLLIRKKTNPHRKITVPTKSAAFLFLPNER